MTDEDGRIERVRDVENIVKIHRLSRWIQLVEKVQHMLGFLLFLWYNKSGDENVGKES